MTLVKSNRVTALAWPVMALAVCAFLFASCSATNKREQALMQNQITRIDEKVSSIHKTIKIQADMAANIEQLDRSVLAMNSQFEESNMRAQNLNIRIKKLEDAFLRSSGANGAHGTDADISVKLDRIEEQIARLSFELSRLSRNSGTADSVIAEPRAHQTRPPLPESVPEPAKVDPDDLYQRSYNSYLRGDYNSALTGFASYLSLYPNTDLSDNAAYWIGEAYFGAKDYTSAYSAFDKMAGRYPTSNKAPTALMKSAEVLLKLDDKGGAVDRFKKIIDRYPASAEALSATDKLGSMSASSSTTRP